MIETQGRRFVRAANDTDDLRAAVERVQREDAIADRARERRLDAEALSVELAAIVVSDDAKRRHAEMIDAELQGLASGIAPLPAIPALPQLLV